MKKLLCSLLLALTITTVPVYAKEQEDWAYHYMDPDVQEFVDDLFHLHYFDSDLPYQPLIELTRESIGNDNVCKDAVRSMLSEFRRYGGGELDEALGKTPNDFARALGFRDNEALRATTGEPEKESDVKPLYRSGVHRYRSDSVLQCVEYKTNEYWIATPVFTDYTYNGDLMYLFSDEYRAVVDLDKLLSECIKNEYFGKKTLRCECLLTDIPIYVTETEDEAKKLLSQRVVCDLATYCDVEWTEDDIHAACELFKEKLGFVPAELDMLLQHTVEYLTVSDNQINVRTGYVWPVEVDGELYVVVVPTLYSDGELNGDVLTITLFDGVQGDIDLRKFAEAASKFDEDWVCSDDLDLDLGSATGYAIKETTLKEFSSLELSRFSAFLEEEAFIISAME